MHIMTQTNLMLSAGALLAMSVVFLGYRLHRRYRAAIDYAGIGRPYPIGNSVLAFTGIAMMIIGGAAAGVILMVLFF